MRHIPYERHLHLLELPYRQLLELQRLALRAHLHKQALAHLTTITAAVMTAIAVVRNQGLLSPLTESLR